MSKPAANTITVTILDQPYQVACPPEQQEALKDAARYLDEQMRAIRTKGRVLGLERIAVMAALNLSFELIHGDQRPAAAGDITLKELRELSNRIGDTLQDIRQLQI